MKPTSIILSVALLAALAALSGRALAEEVTDATVAGVAKRFAAAIACGPDSKDPHRAWCAVARVDGASFAAPGSRQTFLGLSMRLADKAEVPPALLETTQLAILHVGPADARVTALTPSNEDEKKELAAVVASLALVLKGTDKAATVEVSKGLAGFLEGQGKKPGYPLAPAEKGGARYQGKLASSIHLVPDQPYGDAFVVIEQAEGGVVVSIFPRAAFRGR